MHLHDASCRSSERSNFVPSNMINTHDTRTGTQRSRSDKVTELGVTTSKVGNLLLVESVEAVIALALLAKAVLALAVENE